MKIVPVIKVSDLQRSLDFYTRVLDFKRKWPGYEEQEMANGVIDLALDGAELQLSRHAGDGVFGSVSRIFVDDVDERYATFRSRGLDTTRRPDSPLHNRARRPDLGLPRIRSHRSRRQQSLLLHAQEIVFDQKF